MNKNKIVTEFWNSHFKYADTTLTIAKRKVGNLFHQLHGNEINFQEFTVISGKIGVKGKRARNWSFFFAEPISDYARTCYQTVLNVTNTSEVREKRIECMDDDEDQGDENSESEENLEEFIVLDEYRLIEVNASHQNNSILAGERKRSGKRKCSAENLQEFCETHYIVEKTKGTIPMQDVYKFYQATTTQDVDDFQTFKRICGNPLGIKKTKLHHYHIDPKSEKAK